MEDLTRQVGAVGTDGKFYTPKYWVAKTVNSNDVLIATASKSLNEAMQQAEKLYPMFHENFIYVLIEVKNA